MTRSWTPTGTAATNPNYYSPQCNLANPAANGECGPISNSSFGTSRFSSTVDPALLSGFGVRPADWSYGFSIQQQVLPRVSVEAGYTRRWYTGFIVTDNLAVKPSDFSQFSVTAPLDPRLPGGGGYTIAGLYDVAPSLFGVTNNYVTAASNFGKEYNYSNAVDVTASARPSNGLIVQGGFSGGNTVLDTCAIRAALPETAMLNPWCHVDSGFLPQFKALASYVIPKVDVQVSGTFTSKPGIQVNINGTPTGVVGGSLGANYTVSTAVIAQSLGRPLAGNTAERNRGSD